MPRPVSRTPDITTYHDASQLNSSGYMGALSTAFPFMSRHSERRYSDRTLMDFQRATSGQRAKPYLITLALPYEVDELTEAKIGGLIGLFALWPDQQGKAQLVVHHDARRQHHATRMLRSAKDYFGTMSLWVAASNAPGQHLLLNEGFTPTAINSSGAVRYSYGTQSGEE